MAADVVKLTSAKAVSGDALTIKTDGGGVMVNNAKVVKTDIKATNGVIHVIDAGDHAVAATARGQQLVGADLKVGTSTSEIDLAPNFSHLSLIQRRGAGVHAQDRYGL